MQVANGSRPRRQGSPAHLRPVPPRSADLRIPVRQSETCQPIAEAMGKRRCNSSSPAPSGAAQSVVDSWRGPMMSCADTLGPIRYCAAPKGLDDGWRAPVYPRLPPWARMLCVGTMIGVGSRTCPDMSGLHAQRKGTAAGSRASKVKVRHGGLHAPRPARRSRHAKQGVILERPCASSAFSLRSRVPKGSSTSGVAGPCRQAPITPSWPAQARR